MTKSESIKELASALAKAQGAMSGAKKDSSNPFFKSRYADLASCWDACRDPLSQNGLAIIQTTGESDGETVCVETMLTHSSGEFISSVLKMRPVKNDPQGVGSALSYARRYGLMAIVGIAPEDDDGNEATHAKPPAKGKFSPENLEKNFGGKSEPVKTVNVEAKKVDEAVQPDPEEDEAPARWEDVTVHIKCSVQGKKLGELTDDVIQKAYDSYSPKPPYKNADIWLKNGLSSWMKEKIAKESK